MSLWGKKKNNNEVPDLVVACQKLLAAHGFYDTGPMGMRFFSNTDSPKETSQNLIVVGWAHHCAVEGRDGFAGKAGFAIEVLYGAPAFLHEINIDLVSYAEFLNGLAKQKSTSLLEEIIDASPDRIRAFLLPPATSSFQDELANDLPFIIEEYDTGMSTSAELLDEIASRFHGRVEAIINSMLSGDISCGQMEAAICALVGTSPLKK